MAREQRRLAAIVSADVVGYSRLMGLDEAGTLARLKALRRELIDPLLAEHGGRVVSTSGDGMLAEFASTVGAAACAVAVQRGMAVRNAGEDPERRIDYRIGINLGEVIVDGDDIHGDSVNVAARLQQFCQPRGIALSEAAHVHVRGRLDEAFEDLGAQRFRNIADPVQVRLWMPDGAARLADMVAAETGELPLPSRPSIAVLPFANMSADAEQEYFADGITEDVITELSRFRHLFVIARNSVFAYKGRAVDVRQVGRELGVRYVLEGSVRRAGERVRVTAQLIEAATQAHIWAERYDRTLEDIFALQEELTRDIVGTVAPTIEYSEYDRQMRSPPASPTAYDLAMRGMALFHEAWQQNRPNLALEAARLGERAAALDPNAIAPFSAIASAYTITALFRWEPGFAESARRAEAAALRIKEIDSTSEAGYRHFGFVYLWRGRHEQAVEEFRQALAISPNSARTLVGLSLAEAATGRVEAAREHAWLGIRLSPRDRWLGSCYLGLFMAGFAAGDLDDAVKWGETAIRRDPNAPIRRALMTACLAERGDLAAARPHIEHLAGLAPDFIPSLFRGQGLIFADDAVNERMLAGLAKAGCAPAAA